MTTDGTASPPPKRRIPALAYALLGAAVAVGYGVVIARIPVGAPLFFLALGGLALAITAVTIFRAIDPLVRTDPAATDVPAAPTIQRELDRDKQAVLKAIREIELDYQMRKISEQDYKDLTARYRARAMRIIREIDAGDDFRTLIEQELKARLAAGGAKPE